MSRRFVTYVNQPTEGSFTVQGRHLAEATLTPAQRTALCKEAEKWRVKISSVGSFDHDEYGKYEMCSGEHERELIGLPDLTDKEGTLAGDPLVVSGKLMGVVLRFSGGKDAVILYTSGSAVGENTKIEERFEDRRVVYTKTTYTLVKGKSE